MSQRTWFSDSDVTVFQGDALTFQPPRKAEVFIVDPPYARAGAAHSGRQDRVAKGSDMQGANQFWLYWFRDVAAQLARHTTRCGFVFCDWRTIHLVERAFAESGTGWLMTQCLVWDREAIGMGTPFRASHELIAFCRPDDFKWEGSKSLGNVLRQRWPYGAHKHHPAEKPAALVAKLLEWTTQPGETVLDLFCGSGSSLVAALRTGRKGIGCEAEEGYCQVASRRLQAERAGQLTLLEAPGDDDTGEAA